MGGLLFWWVGLGSLVGYVAAQRRGFSPAIGVMAGSVLGPLAVLLFLVQVTVSPTDQQERCPYCAGRITSRTRVCTHCSAILTSD